MKQPVARRANLEDGCAGHFFEQRFYSGARGTESCVSADPSNVLLRHVEGRWFYYPMDGRRNAGPRVATDLPADRTWRLAGVGDFDGDGRDDVLLRHWEDRSWRYYRSADNKQAGSSIAHLTRNPLYGVAAIGDLDGDGKADVLLRRNDSV